MSTGTPLRDILAHRARKGSFAGDPDKYVTNALKMAAEGRTIAQKFDLQDGRTVSLISRPLADGGWVSTHMDISEQRGTERERDLLRQRERTSRRNGCSDHRVSRGGREYAHDGWGHARRK